MKNVIQVQQKFEDILSIRNLQFFPPNLSELPSDQYFLGNPLLTKDQLQNFSLSIKQHNSLQKAIISSNISFNFDEGYIDSLFIHIEKHHILKDSQLVLLFFNIFGYMKIPTDQIRCEILDKIVTILNHVIDNDLLKYCFMFFDALLQVFLDNPSLLKSESISKIFQFYLFHHGIPSIYFPSFLNFLFAVLNSNCKSIIDFALTTFEMLVNDNRPLFNAMDYALFVSVFHPLIKVIDEPTLSLITFFTNNELLTPYSNPDDEPLLQIFALLPNFVFLHMLNIKNCISTETVADNFDNLKSQDFSNLSSLPESLIQSDGNLEDIESPEFFKLVSTLRKFINETTVIGINYFVTTLIDIADHDKSNLPLALLIFSLVDEIHKKIPSTLERIIVFLANSSLFDPNLNIFTLRLPKYINIVRNNLIDLIQKTNTELILILLQEVTNQPFLFSEIVLRINYQYPGTLMSFFTQQHLLFPILSTLSQFQNFYLFNDNNARFLARSSLLFILFNFLSNKENALICYNTPLFASEFFILLFDPNFINHALTLLSSNLIKFDIIPSSIIKFISTLLTSFSSVKIDFHSIPVLTKFFQCILSSFAEKSSLDLPAFLTIYDNILEFFVHCPSPLLHDLFFSSVLSFFSLTNIDFTSSNISLIADYLEKAKIEPNQDTYNKFIQILSGYRTSIPKGPFLIRIPQFLYLFISTFLDSPLLEDVFNLLIDLCNYSPSNIQIYYEADLTTYLLELLLRSDDVYDFPFIYKNHYQNINKTKLSNPKISHKILNIVMQIIKIHSNPHIDDLLIKMISPFPLAQNKFHHLAPLVISQLQNVFSIIKNELSPQYPITSPYPIFSTTFNHEKLYVENPNFLFSFFAKVDVNSPHFLNKKYVICYIHDSDKGISFSFKGNNICVTYHTKQFKYEFLSINKVPANKMIPFSFIINYSSDPDPNIFYSFDKRVNSFQIQRFKFEGNIVCEFGFIANGSLAIGQDSPVIFSKFSMNLPKFPIFTFLDISRENFDIFYNHENCIISHLSMKPNSSSPSNIICSLRNHLSLKPFFNIINQESFKSKYIEALIADFIPTCVDFTKFVPSFQCSYMFSNSFIDYLFSDFTHLFVIIYNTHQLSFKLYLACFSMIEHMPSHNLSELFQNIIFNLFFWVKSDSDNFGRIIRHWNSVLSDLLMPVSLKLSIFEQILIQSYSLMNVLEKTDKKYEILNTHRFSILHQLFDEITLPKPDLFKLIISLMINSNNSEEQLNLLLLIDSNHSKNFLTEELCKPICHKIALNKDPILISHLSKFLLDNEKINKDIPKICLPIILFDYPKANYHVRCLEDTILTSMLQNNLQLLNLYQNSENYELTNLWYIWLICASLTNKQYLQIFEHLLLNNEPFSTVQKALDFLSVLQISKLISEDSCLSMKCTIINFIIPHIEEAISLNGFNFPQFCYFLLKHLLLRIWSEPYSNSFKKLFSNSCFNEDFKFDDNENLDYHNTFDPLQIPHIYELYHKNLEYIHFGISFCYCQQKLNNIPIENQILTTLSTIVKSLFIYIKSRKNILDIKNVTLQSLFRFVLSYNDQLSTQKLQIALNLFQFIQYDFIEYPNLLEEEFSNFFLLFQTSLKSFYIQSLHQHESRFKTISSIQMNAVSQVTLKNLYKNYIPNPFYYHANKSHSSINVSPTPCYLERVNLSLYGTFSTCNQSIIISLDMNSIIQIPQDSILYIASVNTAHLNNCIEIYTASCPNFLIKFANSSPIVQAFQDSGIPVIESSTSPGFLNIIQKNWEFGIINNVNFVLSMNILSFHSFNNILDYPIFPRFSPDNSIVFQSNSKKNNFAQISQLISPSVDMSNFDFPYVTMNFYYLNSNNYFDYLNIIKYRKLLESVSQNSLQFRQWIDQILGISIQLHQFDPLINHVQENNIIFNENNKPIYADFDPLTNEYAIICQNLDIYFSDNLKCVDIKSQIPYLISEFKLNPTNENCLLNHQGIICIFPDYQILLKVSQKDKTPLFLNFPSIITKMKSINNYIIFVEHYYYLCITSFLKFPFNQRIIYSSLHKIIDIQISNSFKMIVMLTENDELTSLTLDGQILGSLMKTGLSRQKFAVTEEMGCIVVFDQNGLDIFNHSFDFIKRILYPTNPSVNLSNIFSIRVHPCNGSDLVTFCDDSSMYYFELEYENIKYIHLKENYFSVNYLPSFNEFVCITTSGKLLFLPTV